MKVRLWGVRGSIAAPLSTAAVEEKIIGALKGAAGVDLQDEVAVSDYVRSLPLEQRGTWGGNTTCVEVRNQADDLVIIDAGTGLRALGQSLLNDTFGRGEGHAAMLFTHTHWDHIQGFPFFAPLFIPGNSFDFYGRHDDLEGRLRAQQSERFFPVTLDQMAATKRFHVLPPSAELFEGRLKVQSIRAVHPGDSFIYRLETDGKSMIMATDAEYRDLVGSHWQRYVDFFHGADILVFDAQYTLREALVEKQNWGHSSAVIGIDLAVDAGVRQIVFVHHEPTYSDDKIATVFEDSLGYLSRVPAERRPAAVIGYEGMTVEL